MSTNLATWERGLSVGAGAALIVLATRIRHARLSLVATGAGLIARGVSGYCPVSAALRRGETTREALGGPRGIHVRESVTIARPVSEVYAVWRNLSNLPTFMRHIERVDVLPDGRTHWVVAGPAGIRVSWDARVINDIPDKLLAWRSVDGAEVVSAGSVRFVLQRDGGTELRVRLQYAPPAAKVGSWVAGLLGANPARQIREDLRTLKHALEAGELPRGTASTGTADQSPGPYETPIPSF